MSIKCPSCGSLELRRSATYPLERARRWMLGGDPYRCRDCGWRGWLTLDDDGGDAIEKPKSRAPNVDPTAALGAIVLVLLIAGAIGLMVAFNSSFFNSLFTSAPRTSGSASGAVHHLSALPAVTLRAMV